VKHAHRVAGDNIIDTSKKIKGTVKKNDGYLISTWLPEPDWLAVCVIDANAKTLNLSFSDVIRISDYALGRLYQTMGTTSLIELKSQLREHADQVVRHVIDRNDTFDPTLTQALLLRDGIAVMVGHETSHFEIKTAISYNAITPNIAERCKRKLADGEYFTAWKTHA